MHTYTYRIHTDRIYKPHTYIYSFPNLSGERGGGKRVSLALSLVEKIYTYRTCYIYIYCMNI